MFFYFNIWYNKYMRKKSFRILSIFLCLTMFFLAGCTGGLGFDGGNGDYASGFQPRQVDGVKAMMKPADYSIAEAVGENSEYFYNLFAGNATTFLFNSYYDLMETYVGTNPDGEATQEQIFNNTNLLSNNIQVDGSVVEDANKQYYYYDSIRYSIQSITINQDENGEPTSAEVVLNLDNGWNFSIQNFEQFIISAIGNRSINSDLYSISINTNTITINFTETYFAIYNDVMEAFGTPGNYGGFYYGDLIMKDETLPNYFDSAYYQQNVAESAVTAVNAYQEVLEYATYLFVLGYDYENADGSVNADGAPFFDFQITYETQSVNINGVDMTVSVPQITVGGWGSGYISITEALARAKRMYEQFGTYIGLTTDEETGNLAQIKRFILDYFVGLDKNPDGTYYSTSIMTVTTRQQLSEGGAYNELSRVNYALDREYETVVENILNYACDQVRIGNAEDGSAVQIDTAYPISQIVDFEGDYFAASFTDENGESDDSDPLRHIAEAEYQNLSFTILDEDVGANFSELVLIFQYYDTGTTDRDLEYLDELTINVGFNYYDSSTGTLYDVGSIRKAIKNQIAMSDADYSAGVDPDENWAIFTVSDAIAESDKVKRVEQFEMKMKFDNNIDGGVLNATENGEDIDGSGYAKAITITGSSPAREYYQMNDSSTYGRYATFNPDMFYGKTDYIEVYFDVEKEEGRENVNYNFKVGLFGLFSDEYMN